MSWWHFSACTFTDYLVKKSDMIPLAEMQQKNGKICDRLIIPTGIVIQWEGEITDKKKKEYAYWFEYATDVIVLDYWDLWTEESLLKQKPDITDVVEKWKVKHQLPDKFNWDKWREKYINREKKLERGDENV
jgi:hypothetical protein